jgi:thiaminase/transcriptional activator TenA
MQDSLFARLKDGSGDHWQHAQQHPFVSALAAGSLEKERFAYFLKQDYVYLIAYSRAIALACARCRNLGLMTEFAGLLHETLATEMQLHRDYCASFGISTAELEATIAAPSCQAYSDFCISSAATGGPLELLCALSPCCVGYGETGSRLAAQIAADGQRWPVGLVGHPYARWIETYSSPGYTEYVDWMQASIDRLGTAVAAEDMARLQGLFDLGCHYEWRFWEMAWAREEWIL